MEASFNAASKILVKNAIRYTERMRYCIDCGRPQGRHEYACPGWPGSPCGCALYARTVHGDARPGEVWGPLQGPLAEVHLPPGRVALLYGGKGAGKSTLALQVLDEPVWVSTEMQPAAVLRYAARVGARVAAVVVPDDALDLAAVPTQLRGRDVVLDSLSETAAPEQALQAVQEYASENGVRALVIAHVTKSGDMRGTEVLRHRVDLVLRLSVEGGRRVLELEKNRHGPTKSFELSMSAQGLEAPNRRAYYSIEGSGSALRLVAYPGGGERLVWAGPLDVASSGKLKLPPPPLAVSAQSCALYDPPWALPEDEPARRAFAEAHGVPYWSPLESHGNRH